MIVLPSPRAGFTLLEVLGALLIFFVVMTVLVGTSSEAVSRIRDVTTRLEASELADQELARLEVALAQKLEPPEDREEEFEEFRVRVSSSPALEDLGGGAAPDEGSGDPLAQLTGGGALGPAIATQAPGIEAFLLRYDIRVEWGDEFQTYVVARTTYGFDWEGARVALPDLFDVGIFDDGEIESASDELGDDAQKLIDALQGATP